MASKAKNDKPQDPTCVHYWIIDPSTGGPSNGTCQRCGETKEFQNSITFTQWGEDKRSAILKQMDYRRNHL